MNGESPIDDALTLATNVAYDLPGVLVSPGTLVQFFALTRNYI